MQVSNLTLLLLCKVEERNAHLEKNYLSARTQAAVAAAALVSCAKTYHLKEISGLVFVPPVPFVYIRPTVCVCALFSHIVQSILNQLTLLFDFLSSFSFFGYSL